MKKLLSLILSITMLTSVAQLSAFADINATADTTEDNPVSVESSVQDETENVAEVTDSEPVLYSTLEQESAKLISLTAEETGFKLADNSDEQANSNSDVQATTTAEQSETEPVTSQATEPDNTTNQPAGVTKVNGNMLKTPTSTDDKYGRAVFDDTLAQNPAFAYRFDESRSCIMPGMTNTLTTTYNGGANPRSDVDCSLMIPQAICTAGPNDEYLLVSAYCGHHQSKSVKSYLHQSVVYVLTNPKTGSPQYLNTLVINARVHVGGIAYDKNTGYLWYGYTYSDSSTTNSDSRNKGTIRAINFNSYIDEIKKSSNLRVKTNNLNGRDIGLSGAKTDFIIDIQPDCMTFYDDKLWVGEFIYNESNTIQNTNIYSYNPANLQPSNLKSINNHTSSITLSKCNRLQGFEFVKQSNGQTCLFASRSYSRKLSKTYISQIDVYKGSGTSYTRTSTIPMPSMVEGVEYTNGRLYTMFESSSRKYALGFPGSTSGDGTQDTSNVCKDVCNRIAALDMTDDLNYDRVLDIGGISGIENVILDQSSSVTDKTNKITLCRNGQWIDTSGGNLKKDSGDTYVFESKVPAGKKWLVRAKGKFQLVSDVSSYNSSIVDTFNPAAASCSGFYVEDNATLEIKNVASDESIFERKDYLDTIISVVQGGTLKIYNKGTNGDIVFDGKNQGVSDAVIRTVSSGSNISKWDIDNVTFRNILDTTSADVCGVHPYGKFSQLNITNCNFQNIKVFKNTSNDNREDAAIFFPRSYIGKKTLIQNCTFDNSAVTSVTNSVDFEAIRFQGTDADFTLDNVSFSNYTTGGYGPVGFVNYNKFNGNIASEHASYYQANAQVTAGRTGEIGNLTLKKVTMTNCNGTSNGVKKIYDMSDSDTNHYYAPLTFSKKITGKLTIKDSKFSNCSGYNAGAIAFDISDSGKADINEVLISGTQLEKDSDGNVVYDTDAEGKPTAPNADHIPAYFYQCQGDKNGGAIGVYGKIGKFDIDKVLIDGCKSTNGSAIMIYGSATSGTKAEIADMKLQYTDIRNCVSKDEYDVGGNNYSGTVRSTGSAACKLTVDHCNITDNYVWKDGGGIYWNAMGTTTDVPKSSLYITDSVISNNTAAESGGGIYCEADITGPNDSSTKTDPGIVRTVISGNKAGKDGGGICQTVYDNKKETSVSLTKTKLALGEKVEIYNNSVGGDGGGVAFILRDSANIADATAANSYSLTFEIPEVEQGKEPAVISNNQAEYFGGGVYYGTGSEITTNDGALDATAQDKINNYTKSINLYAGKINHNKANSHGGGIYSNSGAITFKKGEIDNNEAGADVTVPSVAVGGTISEKSLTNGNGGGGAVFVINGGSVTVYNGFIRNNKAFKHNSDNKNTAFQGNTYDGVGGGICVANGAAATDDKRSKFKLTKEDADTAYNVGIYSNEADFSADDVYASGQYTKLEVPKVGVMNLTDYKGKATGWFEDYNNGDTNYAEYGTSLATEGVGSRYRRNIQQYASKYKIPDTATNARAVNEDMITNFVNANDKYVCMTLGAIASTSITNNIKVPDLDNLGTYKSVSGTPHDVALKYTITRNDGNFTANDLVFDIDGKKFDPGIATPGNTFSFYLKDGETINFPNMSDNIKISVKVEYVKSTNGETISATGENISYVKKTDNKVVTNGIDGTTSASTTSESITTDGNKIQTFTFDNVLVAVRVNINFFDRNLVNGEPADIKSKETTYCKDFIASACEPFFSGDTSDSPVQKMITATGVEVGDKYKNVVDDYHLWNSQTEAEAGIKNFATSNPEYMNLVSKKYTSEENYKFHSNHYGSPTSENWLTYTNVDGTEKKYDDAIKFEEDTKNIVNASKEIGQVNVWLFNTPKKYKVNVYEAPENGSFTKLTEGEKYIFDAGTPKSFAAYYNQRIGTATGDTTQDENTNHLNNYDLSGIIKDSSGNPVAINTAKEITVGDKTYKFSYWSFDENGKTVASTNYGYNYRITTNTDLYPVYEKTPMRLNSNKVGVTTTANQPDVFFDNQGVAKTRLNTVINPYNCDDEDKRISHVSAIYIVASQEAGAVDESVINGLKNIIYQYYTKYNVTSSSSMDISTFIDTMKNQNPSLDLTIKNNSGQVVTINRGMYYVYTAKNANLTNKNRTEFTLTFNTSALKNKRLLAFTAMKFNGGWKVSDNCYDYSFDGNGAMNYVKNITSVY